MMQLGILLRDFAKAFDNCVVFLSDTVKHVGNVAAEVTLTVGRIKVRVLLL